MSLTSPRLIEHLKHRHERQRLFPKALLTGLLCGLLAISFREFLRLGETLRAGLLAQLHPWQIQGFLIFFIGIWLLMLISVWLVRWLEPAASGSGMPHLKAVLLNLEKFRPLRIMVVKFLSGGIGISAGYALGREGPTVQMGGAVGALIASWTRSPHPERQTLISAGSAAGLSASFNAPLSGLTFIIEELGLHHPVAFFATGIACVISDLICREVLGQHPLLSVKLPGPPELETLPFFLVIGLAAGCFGALFNRLLMGISGRARAMSNATRVLSIGLLALATAGLGWYAPNIIGSGSHLLDAVLGEDLDLGLGIPLLFLATRLALTLAGYSTSTAGGIFSPVLILGAFLGASLVGIGNLLLETSLPNIHEAAVVGMASLFSAVARTPMTAMVLMVEMTGSYTHILPLFIGVIAASFTADALGQLPIYEALLERDQIDRIETVTPRKER